MKYYLFSVNDYMAHTAHLNEMEDLAYRRMLDYCYVNECGLPESVQQIARIIRMPTHCDSIANALREFFTLHSDNTWHNPRVDREIERMRGKSEVARQNAGKRWKDKEKPEDATAMPPQCGRNAIKQLTTNNKQLTPKTHRRTAKAGAVVGVDALVDLGVDRVVAESWLAVRKDKRQPLTATALQGVIREAGKAGLTLSQAIVMAAENSWAGFKASWLLPDKPTGSKPPDDFIARHTDRTWTEGL